MVHTGAWRFTACAFFLGATLAAGPVDGEMLTVLVGNAGNGADSTGYGSVGYNYQIGKYEVTAGQYTAFLNAVARTDNYGLYNSDMWSNTYGCQIQRSGSSGSYTYSVAADYANRPVNYVSWYDAARFCNWSTTGNTESGVYTFSSATSVSGILDHQAAALLLSVTTAYFIPTENEWYKAAYHDKSAGTADTYFLYPTGSDTAPGRDMTETTNPGNNANYYTSGFLIGSPYYRTIAGEFELSDSPYGTFDQGGNVWEWNGPPNLDDPKYGYRGGAFFELANRMAASSHYYLDPTNEGSTVGFRVASVPEPSTVAALISGGIGVGGLAWCRRRLNGGRKISRQRAHRHRSSRGRHADSVLCQ